MWTTAQLDEENSKTNNKYCETRDEIYSATLTYLSGVCAEYNNGRKLRIAIAYTMSRGDGGPGESESNGRKENIYTKN